uniref:Minor capsid protein P8 central region domain-containing protein n=1 Tax=Florenciella sp. virus SA2 TaxID=3240092 RepID=A0AB39J981_9VIRU
MNNYFENNLEDCYKLPDDLKDKKSSGRIDLDPNENGTPIFMYDKIPKNEKTNYYNATQYMIEQTQLSVCYFSKENIQIIQNSIRAKIFDMTKQKIDYQNYDELKMIMRSIYLQHSMHKPDNITQQIEDLNQKVLEYVIPNVYGELTSYLKYKKDISSIPEPIQRPEYIQNENNNKTLELKTFF